MIGLLIIDMQQAFDLPGWGERSNPQAEHRAQELLAAFRSQSRPVLHVQHVSDNPESFFHTAEAQAGIDQLVIVGLTLPHCVSTTTRMAGNLGFQVTLVADATASFALPDLEENPLNPELLHQVHLASLQGEFAQVLETKEVLEMLEK